MARLMGITLPDDKRVDYALTILYGIGWTNVFEVLKIAKVEANKRVKDLSEDELRRITEAIEKNYKVEGDLRELISENLKRLREINSYRGLRHLRGLPVRGQRT